MKDKNIKKLTHADCIQICNNYGLGGSVDHFISLTKFNNGLLSFNLLSKSYLKKLKIEKKNRVNKGRQFFTRPIIDLILIEEYLKKHY